MTEEIKNAQSNDDHKEVKQFEYIICRVCGYIETGDKIDQVCPACGFPKTVWMEYKPRKINKTRATLLDLHIHPIVVHFPIVGSILSFGLPVLALLVPYALAYRLFDFTALICIILPLLALGGAVTGYVGGKLRYKTTKAPVLKIKLYISILYFIVTLVQSYIGFHMGVHADNALLVIAIGVVSSACAGYLGKLGSYLFAGKFGPYVAG